MFDVMEPFLPLRVGYSNMRNPSDSYVDYKRKRGTDARIDFDLPGLEAVIEYGVWWDWDIEHLYELEACWVYLGRGGERLRVEASWHGAYNPMEVEGRTPVRDGRPLIFSQPGKHAFAPSPDWFTPREEFTPQCSQRAGGMGLLVTPLFQSVIEKTPERDRLAADYLRTKAFEPSFEFVKEWITPREAFTPWEEMRAWIPLRVEEVLGRLAGGLQP
jgi:hypothetical protein